LPGFCGIFRHLIDADGVRQIGILRDPLMLPAPAKSAAG
jgi:hypothetical protein